MKLNIKIKQMNFWERTYLTDILIGSPGIFTAMVEILRLGIESCDDAEYNIENLMGKKIKVLNDKTLEKIIDELSQEEITEIINQILEENKIPFQKKLENGG